MFERACRGRREQADTASVSSGHDGKRCISSFSHGHFNKPWLPVEPMLIGIFQYRSRDLGWAFAGGKRAANVRGRDWMIDSVQEAHIDPAGHLIETAGLS